MKYWLLTSEYPPFYGGGISTYCVHTARMLQQEGHDVSVFVYDNTVRDISISTDLGVRIIRFSPNRTNTRGFLGYSTQLSYEYAAVVKEFIETEGKPDILESQEYLGIAYYLLQFRWLGYGWCEGLKILITAHSPAFLYLPQNHISTNKYPLFWVGEMERFCLKAADLVISPTHFLLQEIRKEVDLSLVPVFVVANPFHNDFEGSASYSEAEEVLLLAKLSVQKGTLHVLEYMEELWKERPELRLTLVGDDSIVYHPEQRSMGDLVRSRYAAEIRSGRLRLLKRQQPSEYARILQTATVALVPSTFDNLPYVALEMMALGKLVLASKQGGQAEIISDGITGFLFDHNIPGDFSTQLQKILSLTAQAKNKIVDSALATIASNYSYKTVYQKKWNLLQTITDRSLASSRFPFLRVDNKHSQEAEPAYNDLLSIVVTFYNSGIYLEQILNNLGEVDYPNCEIIIVDDGSTDPQSLSALAAIKDRGGVRVVSQTNQGLGACRNRGAAEAKGDFLAFIDADDQVNSDYYSKAVKVLSRYSNVHFVGAWTRYFEGSDKCWPTFQPEPPLILYHNLVNSASLVFRRSSFLNAGGNDGHMIFPGLEDYELIVRMAAGGMGGVVLPELLFEYRVRQNSMIRGLKPYKRRLINEYIRSKHADLYAAHAVEILALQEMNGPAHLLDNPSLDYDFADKLPVGGRVASKIATYIKRNKYLRPMAYRFYRMIN